MVGIEPAHTGVLNGSTFVVCRSISAAAADGAATAMVAAEIVRANTSESPIPMACCISFQDAESRALHRCPLSSTHSSLSCAQVRRVLTRESDAHGIGVSGPDAEDVFDIA